MCLAVAVVPLYGVEAKDPGWKVSQDMGVVVRDHGDVVVSHTGWTVVVDLSPADLKEHVGAVRKHVRLLERMALLRESSVSALTKAVLQADSNWMAAHLLSMCDALERQLDGVQQQARVKREAATPQHSQPLLAFVGKLSESLFGTATQEEVVRLEAVVGRLAHERAVARVDGHHQVALLNLTAKGLLVTRTKVAELDRGLRAANQEMIRMANRTEMTLAFATESLYTTIRLSKMKRWFEEAERHIYWVQREADKRMQHVQWARIGVVDPRTMDNEAWQEVLQKIRRELPEGLSIPFTPVWEGTQKMSAHAACEGTMLSVAISVPVAVARMAYQLLEIIPVPVKTPTGTREVDLETKFVVISLDNQFAVPMSLVDLLNCEHIGKQWACPVMSAPGRVSASTQCAVAVVAKQTEKALEVCKMSPVSTAQQLERLDDRTWLAFADHATPLVVTCGNRKSSRSIVGATIVRMAPICSAFFGQKFVPPYMHGQVFAPKTHTLAWATDGVHNGSKQFQWHHPAHEEAVLVDQEQIHLPEDGLAAKLAVVLADDQRTEEEASDQWVWPSVVGSVDWIVVSCLLLISCGGHLWVLYVLWKAGLLTKRRSLKQAQPIVDWASTEMAPLADWAALEKQTTRLDCAELKQRAAQQECQTEKLRLEWKLEALEHELLAVKFATMVQDGSLSKEVATIQPGTTKPKTSVLGAVPPSNYTSIHPVLSAQQVLIN